MKLSSLQKGLVAHWTMSQDSLKGSLLADKTPYENDGTIYGATFATDRMGQANKAMSFDGNDCIEVLNNNSLDFTVNLTISLWLQTTNSLSTLGVISKPNNETGGGSPKYIIDIGDTGQIRFFGYVGTNPVGITTRLGPSYNNGEWHHITGTFNGTDWSIYGDGALIQTYIESCTLENSIYPIYIGARNNNSGYFNGSIADVRIYNRALSQDEITNLYQFYKSQYFLVYCLSLGDHRHKFQMILNSLGKYLVHLIFSSLLHFPLNL